MISEKGKPVRKIKVRLVPPTEKTLSITTPFIKLDSAMKLADAVGSGGMAKMVIEDEQVRVNGEVCTQRGKKLRDGDRVTLGPEEFGVKQA